MRDETEHVKRGATKVTDRETEYDWSAREDGGINSVWVCRECNQPLEIRQRRGNDAYVSIECECCAESLDLRIADIFDFEMETWDTETVHKLGRGEFGERAQEPDTDR